MEASSQSDARSSGVLVDVLRRAPRAPLTSLACLASLLIFIGLRLGPTDSWERLARFGALPAQDLWNGAFWALFTTCFVHIEPLHFFFNVYWMWMLGQVVEHELGQLATLGLFVAAGMVSSAAELAVSGNTGIGLSGLLYALFGFLWGARSRVPAFGAFLTRGLVQSFLLWLVLCFVATWTGVWNVGNFAHLGGLLFGYGVAAATTFARARRVAFAGTVLASVAVLSASFWRPWDGAWVAWRAYASHRSGALAEAERDYLRSLELGAEPAWVWRNLALLSLARGDEASARAARERLAAFDRDGARELDEAMQARADLVRYLEHVPDGVDAAVAQARLAAFDWNFPRAESLLRELHHAHPQDARVLVELARFLLFTKESPSRSDLRQAMTLAQQAVAATARQDAAALEALAEAHFRTGDPERALATAEEERALSSSGSVPRDLDDRLARYRSAADSD